MILSLGERSTTGLLSTLWLWSHLFVVDAICDLALSCWKMQSLPWKEKKKTSGCSYIMFLKSLLTLQLWCFLSRYTSCPSRGYYCTSISSKVQAFEVSSDNRCIFLQPKIFDLFHHRTFSHFASILLKQLKKGVNGLVSLTFPDLCFSYSNFLKQIAGNN